MTFIYLWIRFGSFRVVAAVTRINETWLQREINLSNKIRFSLQDALKNKSFEIKVSIDKI